MDASNPAQPDRHQATTSLPPQTQTPTQTRKVEEAIDRPRGQVRKSRRARWRAVSLILLHVFIAAHIAHWLIAKTTLTPLEPSEIGQTLSMGLINAGALLFIVATLSTAIFGRFFCGWGCHIVALQDLCSWMLGKIGLEPRPFRSRLLVFMPLLAAFTMFAVPTLMRILAGGAAPEPQWHLMTDDLWARFPTWVVGSMTLFVCGFGIVYLLGNKAFCTYACPYGGVFGLVEPLAPLRIRVTDACEGCGHCTAACTSNVRVHEEVRLHQMVVDPGCMKCTDCVSVCPKNALYLGFGRPSLFRPSPRAKPRPLPSAYSWPEEIGLVVAFLVSAAILRKLYDGVPLLFALALAAISAHALLTAWQTRRNADVSYGRYSIKREGNFTRAGKSFAVMIAIWTLFLCHSAWIQTLSLGGSALARESLTALETPASDERRVTNEYHLERALTKLERVERYGLVSVANHLGLLGAGHAQLGRHAVSEKFFRRAIEVSPRYAYAHVWLAEFEQQRGNMEGHLAHLHAALQADPEWPGAHEQLVRSLTDAGQLDRARLELEQLLEQRPSSGPLRLSYAIVLANLGDVARGISETRRVIEAQPRDVPARFNLILLLANQRRFVEANQVCDSLLELGADTPDIIQMCERVNVEIRSGAGGAAGEPRGRR